MDASFPHLGIYIKNLADHIDIFGFIIAFYGIIIGLGMLAGINIATWDAKKRGQNPDIYLDFAIYAIIFSIIGARAYYVIFEWDMYKNDLLQVFNLRAGGLAIYGGVIGAVITLIVFCKVKKQSFFSMADTGVLGLILGQIIGRWGNFFNAEAFGGYTDSLFALRYKLDIVRSGMLNDDVLKNVLEIDGVKYIQVHPTFLYESMWNLAVLIFMLWYRKRKKFEGEVFFIYLGGYGLGRMLIEGLRTDSLLIPGTGIAVSQVLAGACLIVSIICITVGRRRVKHASK